MRRLDLSPFLASLCLTSLLPSSSLPSSSLPSSPLPSLPLPSLPIPYSPLSPLPSPHLLSSLPPLSSLTLPFLPLTPLLYSVLLTLFSPFPMSSFLFSHLLFSPPLSPSPLLITVSSFSPTWGESTLLSAEKECLETDIRDVEVHRPLGISSKGNGCAWPIYFNCHGHCPFPLTQGVAPSDQLLLQKVLVLLGHLSLGSRGASAVLPWSFLIHRNPPHLGP